MTLKNQAIIAFASLIIALAVSGLVLFNHTAEAARVDQMNGAFTIASTTASGSSSLVLATSTGRQFAQISNDGINDVYLAVGQAAVKGKGILLKASGGTFTIDERNLFSGAVNAIATTSTSNLTVIYK